MIIILIRPAQARTGRRATRLNQSCTSRARFESSGPAAAVETGIDINTDIITYVETHPNIMSMLIPILNTYQ